MKLEMPIPADFPIKPGLSLHPLRLVAGVNLYRDTVHGYLKNAEGKTVAVVRESMEDSSFEKGLHELKFLQAAGIKVAKHLPFIGPDGEERMLVEYVTGQEWSRDYADRNPDLYLSTAQKIGNYAADAILLGRPVLTDISSCFQYILHDNEPVLVDLDMHLYDPSLEPDRQCRLAQLIYDEFSDGEGMIPRDYVPEAPRILAPLFALTQQ